MLSSIHLPLFLVATLFCCASFGAEPSPVPENLSTLIGRFHCSTYVVELRDGTLHYTERKWLAAPGEKPIASTTITPTTEQWHEFRKSLDQLDIWRWRPAYHNNAVADGDHWKLEIQYADHTLKTEGSNNYPDEAGAPISTTEVFDRFRASVERLLGGKTFNLRATAKPNRVFQRKGSGPGG